MKTLPPKETQTELHDINIKQLELERQGVELEKTIRQLTEQDDKQQKGKQGWPPAVGEGARFLGEGMLVVMLKLSNK